MRSDHRRWRTAAAAVAGSTVVAAVAWAAGGSTDNSAEAGRENRGVAEAHFAVLRAGAHARPPVAAHAESLARQGLSVRDTRAAGAAGRLFVTGNDDTVCIVGQVDEGTYGGACGSTTNVAAEGLFSVVGPAPDDHDAPPATVSGLVPDGVDRVTVENADGTSTSAAVTANGAQLAVAALPATITFRDAEGAQHRVPLSDFDEEVR